MNYINKLIKGLLLSGLVFSQAGCSKEYQIWLYNFSGSVIVITYPGARDVVEDGKFVLIYNHESKENILLPEMLEIAYDGSVACYSLLRIKEGGYGQYDESSNLLVRLKLEEDKKIYVYRVPKDGFKPYNAVGVQPNGYPVSPTAC